MQGEPGRELVYSEADVTNFRKDWERAASERERERELSAIRGRLDQLPELVRTIARQVVAEVLADQGREHSATRRQNSRMLLGVGAVLVVLVVPVETIVLGRLFP